MYGALKGHGKGHKYEMGGEKCFNVLAQKIGSFPPKKLRMQNICALSDKFYVSQENVHYYHDVQM